MFNLCNYVFMHGIYIRDVLGDVELQDNSHITIFYLFPPTALSLVHMRIEESFK